MTLLPLHNYLGYQQPMIIMSCSKTYVMTNFEMRSFGLRFLERSPISHSCRATLCDTIIDTDVDILSEFTVMDTYSLGELYRLSRKQVRLWVGVMPSSINQKWGDPVFVACLAYECLEAVGRENVILLLSPPPPTSFCCKAMYCTGIR